MTATVADQPISAEELDGHAGGTVWGLLPIAYTAVSTFAFAFFFALGLDRALFRWSGTDSVVWSQIVPLVIAAPFLVVCVPAYRRALSFQTLSAGGRLTAVAWTVGACALALGLAFGVASWARGGVVSFEEIAAGVSPDRLPFALAGIASVLVAVFIQETSLRGMVMGGLIARGEPRWAAALTALLFQILIALTASFMSLSLLFADFGREDMVLRGAVLGLLGALVVGGVLIVLRLVSGSLTACLVAGVFWTAGWTYASSGLLPLDNFGAAPAYDAYSSVEEVPDFDDPFGGVDTGDSAYPPAYDDQSTPAGQRPDFTDLAAAERLAYGYGEASDLDAAMYWDGSPQGFEFWNEQYEMMERYGGVTPTAERIFYEWIDDYYSAPDTAVPPAPTAPPASASDGSDFSPWSLTYYEVDRLRRLADGAGSAEDLDYAFTWAETPQGEDYWFAEYETLLNGGALSPQSIEILKEWLAERDG